MGMAKMQREQKRLETIMPYELRAVFDEQDIEKTWTYLYDTFHFNIKKWKERYAIELENSPRVLTKMEVFARFGKANFERAIEHILVREAHSHTWFRLMQYIVKEKLTEKKKEANHNRTYKR
jgi:hypothetical protein